MSESDQAVRRAGLSRGAARALTLAGAAAGMWFLGQATASAEEPMPAPLPQVVPAVQVLTSSVDQLSDPVVSTIDAVSAPVTPVASPVVEAVTAPVAAVGSQVAEIPLIEVAVPVVVTSDAPEAIGQLVEPAAPPAVELPQAPAVELSTDDGPPPLLGPESAVVGAGEPAPTTVATVPAGDVALAEVQGLRASTPALGAGPDDTTDAPSVPAVPHPSSVPALPVPLPGTTGHGSGHVFDQPSADLAAAVLAAAAAALSAAADDARDSAAAAPFEPSCSPD